MTLVGTCLYCPYPNLQPRKKHQSHTLCFQVIILHQYFHDHFQAAELCPLKPGPLPQLGCTWANIDYLPTHVTNCESDEGTPCHDHTGECRRTDTGAIWTAEIWTPHVRVCQLWRRRPAKTVKSSRWECWERWEPRITKTWTGTVMVRAARRHVLYSEGENVSRRWVYSGCDVVAVGQAQVDALKRCQGCIDHVCCCRSCSVLHMAGV